MANMKTKVLTAVLVAGSLLIPAAASHATVTGSPAWGDRKEASLQRDADAIRAAGITGVQARSTKPRLTWGGRAAPRSRGHCLAGRSSTEGSCC